MKCYSVRLKSFDPISSKCYKAVAYDGSEALIPASQCMGIDYEVGKSLAVWISAWILERKSLQYSRKKSAEFTPDGRKISKWKVSHHTPDKVEEVESNEIEDLER